MPFNPTQMSNKPKRVVHCYLTHCKTNPQPPGLGDFIRGTAALFELSQKYGYELKIDNSHPIFRYFTSEHLIQHTSAKETEEYLPPILYEEIYRLLDKRFQKQEDFSVMTNAFFKNVSDECRQFLKDIFTPTVFLREQIQQAYEKMGINRQRPFSVIHLRFGDFFLHNNQFNSEKFVYAKDRIQQFLQKHPNNQYVLVTDAGAIGSELKKHIPELFYLDNQKIHSGDLRVSNANEVSAGIINTLVDFLMFSECQNVLCLIPSGFSHYSCILFGKDYIRI